MQIGGIIPMLQKEIAAGVRDGLNAVLPKAATTVENTFRQTPIKDIAIEKILWFVYDYMKDVTLNSLVTTVLDRANLGKNSLPVWPISSSIRPIRSLPARPSPPS